jgi:intein/homing endonuclease
VDEDIIHLSPDGELIETTAKHPFYTDDGVWIDAADLTAGEEILSLDGNYGIVERGGVLWWGELENWGEKVFVEFARL